MSTEHAANTVVGYTIPIGSFFKPLLRHHPEESCMEARFDAKTGKKVAPVKIVTQHEGYELIICNETFEGPDSTDELEYWQPDDDAIQAIQKYLDCDVTIDGDFYNGCCIFVCLSSTKMTSVREGEDVWVPIKEVTKCAKDLERIGKACKKLLKVDPGPLGIHSVLSAC